MRPIYKLRDWIDESKLDFYWICNIKHPCIIPFLTKHKDKLTIQAYYTLGYNKYVVDFIEENPDQLEKMQLHSLSMNPFAIKFLERHPHIIQWGWLSANPAAMHILEKNPGKINWHMLSKNPAAIDMLEKNLDKVDWDLLKENHNRKKLIKKKPKKSEMPRNPIYNYGSDYYEESDEETYESDEDRDIEEIIQNFICEHPFYSNYLTPEKIDFFKENPDKINWNTISGCKEIFVYDYAAMRRANREFKEKLARAVLRPEN